MKLKIISCEKNLIILNMKIHYNTWKEITISIKLNKFETLKNYTRYLWWRRVFILEAGSSCEGSSNPPHQSAWQLCFFDVILSLGSHLVPKPLMSAVWSSFLNHLTRKCTRITNMAGLPCQFLLESHVRLPPYP